MDMYMNALSLAIDNAMKLIDSITNNTKFEVVESELHYALLSMVHFVGDVYGRHQQYWDKLSIEEQEYFLAFVYLNNQLKHDNTLNVIYYRLCGSMFPMSFPFHFGPPCVCWADFEDHESTKVRKRAFYDANLKQKNVKATLERLRQILDHISSEVTNTQ